jgi:hypothetical protein
VTLGIFALATKDSLLNSSTKLSSSGIGKTRSCLLGCLALLLSKGAPVLYLASKSEEAFLFIPKLDGSGYLAWDLVDYDRTLLTGDMRMIVLMDPPEEDGYKWRCKARLVKVCSNNHQRHFQNVEKSRYIKVLYPAMPKLEEIFAMAKVLWNDTTTLLVKPARTREK